MNKKYNDIKKKINDLFIARTGLRSGDPKPVRDWFILLTGSTVSTLAFVGIGVFLYFSLLGQASQEMLGQTARLPINKEHLTNMLDTFEERSTQFEYLREHPEVLDIPNPAPVLQVLENDEEGVEEEAVEQSE